jgi:hypothetical protein
MDQASVDQAPGEKTFGSTAADWLASQPARDELGAARREREDPRR